MTCSSEGVECDNSGDNLIDAMFGVLSLEECRDLCLEDARCNFISYRGDLTAPISHLCQMFTTCDDTINSTDVISENMKCYRSCGSNVVGDLDENIQDILTDIESEQTCRESCLNIPKCSYYTFFYPNDTHFENYCILQTEFVGPAQSCNTCISGPVDCPAVKCSISLDGEEQTSLILTNTDKIHDVTIAGLGWCNISFLLVGGGGSGQYQYGGGGGSGYLEFGSLQVSAGAVLTAQVGDQTESSSVTFSSGDIYAANPGQDGQPYDGGAGYSGGGESGRSFGYGGEGGTDGGDGHAGSDGSGGHGTGEDVSSFTFTAWNIEAGAGGMVYTSANGYNYGGGGGGVLVNGQGPQPRPYQGQGYGGGGNGNSAYPDGNPGVIFIEII